jgi:acyl dehydratase
MAATMKQLGEGWNWRELKIGNRFITYGRTLFEADLLNFVTLCGFSEELFTNKEYVKEHAPMRGGHPVPGALVYSMAEGLVIPTTLQGTGLAFLSMGFDIKGPTYVGDTIHVEIELTEIRPTSKDPMRALVRTTNNVVNQKGETVLVYTPLRMMQGRSREGAPWPRSRSRKRDRSPSLRSIASPKRAMPSTRKPPCCCVTPSSPSTPMPASR